MSFGRDGKALGNYNTPTLSKGLLFQFENFAFFEQLFSHIEDNHI